MERASLHVRTISVATVGELAARDSLEMGYDTALFVKANREREAETDRAPNLPSLITDPFKCWNCSVVGPNIP